MADFNPSQLEQQNPLQKYFRTPKVYVTLPSGGQYYPAGAIDMPENGELPVFNMELIEDTDVNVYLVDDEVGKFMTFPKQEPIKITKSELISQTNLTKEEVYETHPTTMNFKLEKANDNVTLGKLLKWGEFKKFCTSVGISVKGKTRKELEQELKEL